MGSQARADRINSLIINEGHTAQNTPTVAFGRVGQEDLKSKASLSSVVRPTDSSKAWGGLQGPREGGQPPGESRRKGAAGRRGWVFTGEGPLHQAPSGRGLETKWEGNYIKEGGRRFC